MDIPEHYRDTFGGTPEPTRKLDVGVLDMGTGRMHGNDNVHLIALPLELAQLDAANMYQDQSQTVIIITSRLPLRIRPRIYVKWWRRLRMNSLEPLLSRITDFSSPWGLLPASYEQAALEWLPYYDRVKDGIKVPPREMCKSHVARLLRKRVDVAVELVAARYYDRTPGYITTGVDFHRTVVVFFKYLGYKREDAPTLSEVRKLTGKRILGISRNRKEPKLWHGDQ